MVEVVAVVVAEEEEEDLVQGPIAPLQAGVTLVAVRRPVDGEQFSRLEVFLHTRAVVAQHAHLPTVLKEGGMLLVTTDAVPLTVCGRGIVGDLVWDAGIRRKLER